MYAGRSCLLSKIMVHSKMISENQWKFILKISLPGVNELVLPMKNNFLQNFTWHLLLTLLVSVLVCELWRMGCAMNQWIHSYVATIFIHISVELCFCCFKYYVSFHFVIIINNLSLLLWITFYKSSLWSPYYLTSLTFLLYWPILKRHLCYVLVINPPSWHI